MKKASVLNLKAKLTGSEIRKGALFGFGMKAFGYILVFASSILLSRILGIAEFGNYAVLLAISSLAAAPVTAGIPHLLVKELAPAFTSGDKYVLGRFFRFVLIVLFVHASILVLSGMIYSVLFGLPFFNHLLLVPVLAIAQVVTSVRSAALRATGNIVRGQLIERVIQPTSHLFIFLFFAWIWGEEASGWLALGALVLSHVLGSLIGGHWLRKRLKGMVGNAASIGDYKGWSLQLFPISINGLLGMALTNGIVVLLGSLASLEMAGLYRVANAIANLSMMIHEVLSQVVAPQVARLWSAGKKEDLSRLLSQAVVFTSLYSLVFVLAVFLFGKDIVGILYGEDFLGAYLPIVVLGLAQLSNVLGGYQGILLTMSGNAWLAARVLAILTPLVLTVSFVLVAQYQALGAAFAIFAYQFAALIFLTRIAIAKTHIDPSIIGGVRQLVSGKKIPFSTNNFR